MTSTRVPFTNDGGLRDYRARLDPPAPPKRPLRLWLVLVAFLLGLVLGTRLSANERCVRLQVRPPILLRRGDVDVQARVARHADHRALTIAWDSDIGAAGSRTFALDGDADRALFQWWNIEQPAGHYVFDARVYDAGGLELGRDRVEIRAPEIKP